MTVSIYYYSLFFIQLLQNLQYPHTIFLMWNAQGQLSAPILSLRSSAAYRPAGATFRNRQTACPKDDNGSGTCVGYCRTLRPRSSAREAGDSVVAVNQKLARLKI